MLSESKRVSVGVRIRPKLDGTMNSLQTAERYEPMACTRHSDTTLCVCSGWEPGDSRSFFAYDAVFDESTTQEEIFDELASAAVEDVLTGTNASILTYGQTGSGKTYTVLGGVQNNPSNNEIITSDTGILLRALQDVLHYGEVHKNQVHFVVVLSAVEIYLDEVRDLFSGETTPALVQMTLVRDVVQFSKLTYFPIYCLDDGMKAFHRATARRVQRMTSANDTSSRSHLVFNIEVFQQPVTFKSVRPLDFSEYMSMKNAVRLVQREGGTLRPLSHPLFEGASNPLLGPSDAPVMYSKLSLVDLAGSERVRNANVRGEGFDELKKINTSLTALGNVVHGLYEGSRHIPYRDSKLTVLLRDCFATPHARVVLIVTLSPTVLTVEETLSSLHFADKVKMLKPDPRRGGMRENNIVCDYYLSLRKFDELLADVRVAGLLHKFHAPQIVYFLANDMNNIVYDVTFRVQKPECKIRQMAVSMMCEAFKINAEKNSQNSTAQQQWGMEIEKTRKTVRSKLVAEWKTKRDVILSRIENFSADIAEENVAKEQALLGQLNEASDQLKDVRAVRREVQKKCKIVATSILEAEDLICSIEKELQSTGNTLQHADSATSIIMGRDDAVNLEQQEESWTWISEQATQAVALANMRLDLCLLLCETQRLAVELKAYTQEKETDAAQVQTVYDWLHHAVWAMAGNAVVISVKRKKRRSLQEPGVFSDCFAINGNAAPRPRQYWQPRSSENNSLREKKCRGSRYDDTTLLEDIMSFVKMGGKVMKYSQNGSSHRRLLYVEGKAGGEELCWSAVGSMGREGCIPLCAITQIILGRGHDSADQSLLYLGWGVVRKKGNSTKIVDFLCDTLGELEAWVIGLSYLTSIKPLFGESMKVTPETRALWNVLSANDVAFCEEWHIPFDVYMEAWQQLLSRFHAQRQKGPRLSPGELRNLVKLDIFRASAMWQRFYTKGLVTEPKNKIYNYVDISDALKETSVGTPSYAVGGLSNGLSLKSINA